MWADKPSSKEKHFAKNIHPCINSTNYWFIRWAGPTRGKCGRCKARVSYLECGLEYQIWIEVSRLWHLVDLLRARDEP